MFVRMIEDGELPLKYFLIGDEAYVPHDQMLTNYSAQDTEPGSSEDTFNFYLSSNRIRIECAFGRLVQRCGILWRPLRGRLPFISSVVFACMILHNLCFDNESEHDDIERVGVNQCRNTGNPDTQFASVPDGGQGYPNVYEQGDCYNRGDGGNKRAAATARVTNRQSIDRRDRIAADLHNYWEVRRKKK